MGHSHHHHDDPHEHHSHPHEPACAHGEPAHHHHDHLHHHPTLILSERHFWVLRWVFGLTCIYLVIEVVGGLLSGSLALLADGFHMFADAMGIGLSLFAAWLSHRPAPAHRTFGYQRVEILAAFFNSLLLMGMGLFILYESYERFQSPEPIKANLMLGVAAGGLVVNIIAAKLLHQDHHHNLNIKGAYLHVLGDLLGSVGAIVAGLCILFFGWNLADPLISCLIAGLIMISAVGLLKEAVNVLLEGCPSHIDIDDIKEEIFLSCEGVKAIHNLHVWNINMQQAVLTAHLEVTPEAFNGNTLTAVQNTLKEKFGLSHVTLQLELQ